MNQALKINSYNTDNYQAPNLRVVRDEHDEINNEENLDSNEGARIVNIWGDDVKVDSSEHDSNEETVNKQETKQGEDGKDAFSKAGEKVGIYSNVAAGALHTLAIATQVIDKLNIPLIPKDLTGKINKFTQEFSRYVVPFNYLLNGISALKGNRLLEGLIRFSIPGLLLTVPFFNFTIPYGISSGFNFFHEAVLKNLKDKNGHLSFKDWKDNTKQVWDESKNIFKALFSGESIKELLSFKLSKQKQQAFGSLSIALSAAASLLTARTERNSFAAKLWGGLRNGLGGYCDLILAFGKDDVKPGEKEFVGSIKELKEHYNNKATRKNVIAGGFMGVASALGVFHRLFVKSEWLANIIVHLQMLLDNIGFTAWGLKSNDITNEEKQNTSSDEGGRVVQLHQAAAQAAPAQEQRTYRRAG